MNVFQSVKEAVTVRQAAEYYGIRVQRNGMCCCPFHHDKTPSMKVDRRYYCFGCGISGDVIDFTGALLGLDATAAAMKLAADFGISYEYRGRGSPKKKEHKPGREVFSIKPKETDEQIFKKERDKTIRIYFDYLGMLREWKKTFAPKSPGEEYAPEFVRALTSISVIEYYLDILLSGEEDDQRALLNEKQKEMIILEQECKQYREKPLG